MYKKLLRVFLFVIFAVTCSCPAIAQTDSDATDMAEVEIAIEVPANEPPGDRNITVVFTGELSE